jgi:hypothetical protein
MGASADQHRHRAGSWHGEAAVDLVELALVADAAGAEQRHEHRQVVAHVRGGPRVGEPVQILDHRPV